MRHWALNRRHQWKRLCHLKVTRHCSQFKRNSSTKFKKRKRYLIRSGNLKSTWIGLLRQSIFYKYSLKWNHERLIWLIKSQRRNPSSFNWIWTQIFKLNTLEKHFLKRKRSIQLNQEENSISIWILRITPSRVKLTQFINVEQWLLKPISKQILHFLRVLEMREFNCQTGSLRKKQIIWYCECCKLL